MAQREKTRQRTLHFNGDAEVLIVNYFENEAKKNFRSFEEEVKYTMYLRMSKSISDACPVNDNEEEVSVDDSNETIIQ